MVFPVTKMSLLIDQSSGGAFPNNEFKKLSKASTLLRLA
jgi:hypothetical protein